MNTNFYLRIDDLEGNDVAVFLNGIVMIAPRADGEGTYIQLTLGGISTKQPYEEILRRIDVLQEGGHNA